VASFAVISIQLHNFLAW